jgi:hypothetical protein
MRSRKLAHAALPARDAHVRAWWLATSQPVSKTIETDWGRITLSPPSDRDPGDIRIDFKPSIAARREAFVFARAMYDEVRVRSPELDAEFIAATDHYHVLVMTRAARLAGNLARSAMNVGAALAKGSLSGTGSSGRAEHVVTTRISRSAITAED